MRYEKQTAQIRAGLFAVQNEVGLGRSEDAYHKALAQWLREEGIPFESKQAHHLLIYGEIAHTLYPDFVIWDSITLELKAVSRRLRDEDKVQLFNYLKRRGDRLGLLINMGLDRVYVDRIAFDPIPPVLLEDWTAWEKRLPTTARNIGHKLRGILLSIYHEHGSGYGTEIMGDLLRTALRTKGLAVEIKPTGESSFHGLQVGRNPFDCWIIEDEFLLTHTALFDRNDFNIHRGLSFMKDLNVNQGLAVNFGKHIVQINALIRPS